MIDAQRGDPNLSDQDRADLDQWKRLPFVSAADAQALLGPVAKKLAVPQRVKDLEHALATIGPSAVWTAPSTSPSPSKAPTTPQTGTADRPRAKDDAWTYCRWKGSTTRTT